MAGSRNADDARSREPATVGQVLREALSDARMAQGVALGRLARGWEQVVGPQLAGRSAPSRLDGGRLVVEAVGAPWAAQVEFLSEEIRRRANEALGGRLVDSVHVVLARGGRGRML